MIKRLLFKSFVLLALFTGAGTYVAYLKGVDVWATLTNMGSISRMLAGFGNLDTPSVEGSEDGSTVLRAGRTRVYKWQDAAGQWHYTQLPPPADALAVQSLELSAEQNVIAGLKPADAPPDPQAQAPAPTPAPSAPAMPDNPYSPDAIKQMFEDAQALQGKLNERFEAQQKLLQPRQPRQ